VDSGQKDASDNLIQDYLGYYERKRLNVRDFSGFYLCRLRHPSSTAPRGPPSPKIREKADKFVCASSLFSEYCLGYNLLLVKLEYFIEKVCDNSIKSVK